MKKKPLSVAIICQDEQDRIRDCLESVGFAQEIVVVDSGSKDRTVEIAGEYTDRVIFREWTGWRDQMEYSSNQCANEWVLRLDADEIVSEEMARQIKELLSRDEIIENGFSFPRLTSYQGRWIRHCGWYPDRVLRLYRKSKAVFGGDDPHVTIEVDGPVGELSADLLHYTYRDLRHHAERMVRYGVENAEARHERGVRFRISDLLLRPPYAFLKAYVLKRGFQDGMPGFLIGAMMGYYTFLKYARLWEIQRENK